MARPKGTTTPPIIRFWKHVNRDGPIPECAPHLGRCWLWTGSLTKGYGQFPYDGGRYAHRFAFEFIGGEKIPAGLQLDHLCRVTACVRPNHLQPVTVLVNLCRGIGTSRAQTHCIRGHEFELTGYRLKSGRRRCRICQAIRQAKYEYRKSLGLV